MPWNRVAAELQRLLLLSEDDSSLSAAGGAVVGGARSGKQCRERWVHRLRPGVTVGDWAQEEEEQLFDLVRG